MSAFKTQEESSNWKTLTTSLAILIKIVLAKNKDNPLIEKANTMAAVINKIIVLSCSMKIFLTAGSKSQAIAAVPPATPNDKTSAINILKKCFFT